MERAGGGGDVSLSIAQTQGQMARQQSGDV
jgi:hypothetical protein